MIPLFQSPDAHLHRGEFRAIVRGAHISQNDIGFQTDYLE